MVMLSTRPGAHASVRNIRVSAFKARPVLRLIQGKSYEEAVETLKFCDRGAADVITKCLQSAAANAEHNEGIDPEETFVSDCFADEGPTLRRWRPRARGRATRIQKRTSHITIHLVRYTPEELAERAARESTASAASAEARRRRVAASRGEEVEIEEAESLDADEETDEAAIEGAATEATDEAATEEAAEAESEPAESEAAEETAETEEAASSGEKKASGEKKDSKKAEAEDGSES